MIQESLPLATSVYGESVLDLALSCETRGPRVLSDIELIALLFKLDQHAARQWLRQMGSLSALVNQSPSAQAIIEFSRRYIEEDIRRGDALVDVSSVRDYS